MNQDVNERTYSEDEVTGRLAAELPHWSLDGGVIRRRFRTNGWKSSLMVVNAVGHLAEAAWHHPDISVSYGSVIVDLSTHSAGPSGRLHEVAYPPGQTHAHHAHARSSISLILHGDGDDDVDGTTHRFDALTVIIKPAHAVHRTECGRRGVRSVSFEVPSEVLESERVLPRVVG